MKKKTKILFSVLVLTIMVTLGNINFAWAGCCINSNSSCINGSSIEDCPSGYIFYRENSCPDINECNQSNSFEESSLLAETTTFANPLKVTTVSGLLNNILSNLRGILVFIAVIFIVLGGIMYMLSGGNEEMVKRAKKTWTGAIIGLAIALAAPTFLKEIQEILGGNGGGESADAWVSNALTIKQIVVNVLELLLSILGIVAIISIIIGGGMYLTAYGDEKRIDKAKSIVTYSIIGIVISLSAVIIIKQIGALLGG